MSGRHLWGLASSILQHEGVSVQCEISHITLSMFLTPRERIQTEEQGISSASMPSESLASHLLLVTRVPISDTCSCNVDTCPLGTELTPSQAVIKAIRWAGCESVTLRKGFYSISSPLSHPVSPVWHTNVCAFSPSLFPPPPRVVWHYTADTCGLIQRWDCDRISGQVHLICYMGVGCSFFHEIKIYSEWWIQKEWEIFSVGITKNCHIFLSTFVELSRYCTGSHSATGQSKDLHFCSFHLPMSK